MLTRAYYTKQHVVMSSAIDKDEQSTDMLVARFNKHVSAVNGYHSGTLGMSHKLVMWHTCAARGLHKLLAERAIAADDELAGNTALGAPHWLTFSNEQIAQQC